VQNETFNGFWVESLEPLFRDCDKERIHFLHMGLINYAWMVRQLNSFASKWEEINKGFLTLVALPFILKKYLKAKEELWKLKYFTMQKI
jgi:hypothetical protein